MNACPDEPTLAELQREFPDWVIEHGTSLMYFARKQGSALIMGEDTTDMRDQINGWIGRNEA